MSAGARFGSCAVLLALLCVSSGTRRARAEPAAAPRVQYEATGACPQEAEFRARMQARMDADGTRAPGDISLRVTLSVQGGKARGIVEIRRGTTNTRRIVDGARCEEVVDALALIAALAVRDAEKAREVRTRPRARKSDKHDTARGPQTTTAKRIPTANSADTNSAVRRVGSAPNQSGSTGGADSAGPAAKRAPAGASDSASSSASDVPDAPSLRNEREPMGVASARGSTGAAEGPVNASDADARNPQDETSMRRARDGAGRAQVRDGKGAVGSRNNAGDDSPRDGRGAGDPRNNAGNDSSRRRQGGAGSRSAGEDDPPDGRGAVGSRNSADEDDPRSGQGAGDSGDDARAPGWIEHRSDDPEPAAESGSDDVAKASRSHEAADAARWRLGATAVLFSGLAPALQAGLQLQAAVALSAGALAWSLQIGARIAQNDAVASPDGDARFGFAGGVLRLCAAHALGSAPLTLTGCAAAEPGIFSAKGENTRNHRSHSRPWLAAGAAADLSVQLTGWLSLRAGAELLAPFRRDRIVLAGDTLYRIPALGFRWYLGLEVPFG